MNYVTNSGVIKYPILHNINYSTNIAFEPDNRIYVCKL